MLALGIADCLDHRPSQLSGGQQQRVAVARALAGRPEVVFADEPTGALDTASAASLLQALAAMCRNLGQTVVMVTHDENAAAATNRPSSADGDGIISHARDKSSRKLAFVSLNLTVTVASSTITVSS